MTSCCKDSILEQRTIKDLITRCRKLCGHLNHSPTQTYLFKSLQSIDVPLILVQDVVTRWNSTFLMFERMLVLKVYVIEFFAESEYKLLDNEWHLLEQMVVILQPFFDLTKSMSAEITSLAEVIPNMISLKVQIQ